MTTTTNAHQGRSGRSGRLLMGLWLLLVWLLLWGRLDGAVLLSGVVVAVVCVLASRLPALPSTERTRWGRLPGMLARFSWDLLRSTAAVAVTVVRRGPRTRSAIVEVQVPCASDLVLALVCQRLSLVPGTVVLAMDRSRDVLFLYALDVSGPEAVERARADAQRAALDVVRTFAPGAGKHP